MPNHKNTLEFEATTGSTATSGAKAGWTESFYDLIDATPAVALERAQRLALYRRRFLTHGWSILSVRISELEAVTYRLLRRSFHYFFPPGSQAGEARMLANNTGDFYTDEQPYDALAVAYRFANGQGRTRDHRGIPNEIIAASGRFLGAPGFNAAFGNWAALLAGTLVTQPANPWGQRFRINDPRLDVVGVQTADSQNVHASPVRPALLVRGAVLSAQPGFVRVSGVIGMRGMNGEWEYSSVVGGDAAGTQAFLLRQKRRHTVIGVYGSGGTAQPFHYELSAFTGGAPQYGTSRNTGRPTQLPRGRRSASQT